MNTGTMLHQVQFHEEIIGIYTSRKIAGQVVDVFKQMYPNEMDLISVQSLPMDVIPNSVKRYQEGYLSWRVTVYDDAAIAPHVSRGSFFEEEEIIFFCQWADMPAYVVVDCWALSEEEAITCAKEWWNKAARHRPFDNGVWTYRAEEDTFTCITLGKSIAAELELAQEE